MENNLNIYVSYDNKTNFVLFVNFLDKFYVDKNVINYYDQIIFINTPKQINYLNPINLIYYYNTNNIHFKYSNLLTEGLYFLLPLIIDKLKLLNKDEFLISFENNKYISSKSKESPYYFRQEYINNPNYYYIKLNFKKIYDKINNQFYFDVIISYKLNVNYNEKSKVILNIFIYKLMINNPDYNDYIIYSLISNLDKNF